MDKQQHRVPFVIRLFCFLTEGIVEGIGPNAAAVFDWIALVIDVGDREAQARGGINDFERFGNVKSFCKRFKRSLLCVGVVIAGDTIQRCLKISKVCRNVLNRLQIGRPR